MVSLRHFETGLEFDKSIDMSINCQKTESFIDTLVSINILPFKNKIIFFNDNHWDFRSFTQLNIAKKDLRFNYINESESYRTELKKYVLIKILENKMKITSIQKSFRELSIFFDFIYGLNTFSVIDLTHSSLKAYLSQRKKVSDSAIRFAKHVLRNFFAYYAVNYTNILSREMEELLFHEDTKLYNARKENNKTPDIPSDYFNNLMKSLMLTLDAPDSPMHIKASACIILIQSQTGLRIGEVLALHQDSLKTVSIYNDQEANYISYKTWKREKGENKYSIEQTFVNPITKMAFHRLKSLHQKRRDQLDLPYLYIGNKLIRDKDDYPVDCNAFLRAQKELYLYLDKYIPTVNLPDNKIPGIHSVKIKSHFPRSKNKYGESIHKLTYPTTIQYRVHVCTELYNKGVPLKYIQKFMTHLTSDMQGYYVRPKKQTQENVEFSQKTLSDIISGEIVLLGSNSIDIKQKIDDFIKDNKYSIATNLNEIVESLMKKIPIRQKMGGVCIKSSILRECSIDAKTNDFYCAYGVCPNIFHFFYNIDISYRKAHELIQSIEINSTNGFKKQVQKEKNMLSTVITKQLIPELNELKNEMTKKSIENIYLEYPDIKDIIENLDHVEKEISNWTNLIKESRKN